MNIFADGQRFISGNRCDKPVTGKAADDDLNLYAYKLDLLLGYGKKQPESPRGTIGLPLCLNMYELLPFWHTLFTRLGFAVKTSPVSSRALYQEGRPPSPAIPPASPPSWPTATLRSWSSWAWTPSSTLHELQRG